MRNQWVTTCLLIFYAARTAIILAPGTHSDGMLSSRDLANISGQNQARMQALEAKLTALLAENTQLRQQLTQSATPAATLAPGISPSPLPRAEAVSLPKPSVQNTPGGFGPGHLAAAAAAGAVAGVGGATLAGATTPTPTAAPTPAPDFEFVKTALDSYLARLTTITGRGFKIEVDTPQAPPTPSPAPPPSSPSPSSTRSGQDFYPTKILIDLKKLADLVKSYLETNDDQGLLAELHKLSFD